MVMTKGFSYTATNETLPSGAGFVAATASASACDADS